MNQQDLWEDEQLRLKREHAEWWDAVREVITRLGLKEVAYHLQLDPGTVANAIAARDRKSFPGTWIATLVRIDPEKKLLRCLAEDNSFALIEQDRRSPEEKLAETVAYLQRQGETGFAILKALRLAK